MTRFQEAKKKYTAAFNEWVHDKPHLREIKNLSEVMNVEETHHGDLKVGDTVEVINGYGHKLKGFCILAFEKIGEEVFVYLDWDCYWFSKPIGMISGKVEPCINKWFDGEEITDDMY